MFAQSTKKIVKKILSYADVEINGKKPWDIQVKNKDFYSRVLAGGSLAFGESYMDGWWECERIDQLINKLLRAEIEKKIGPSVYLIWNIVKAKIINQQRKSKSHIVGKRHYDIGNDLYENMLDKRMNYSCAYWKNAKTLDEAQEDKLDLICRKLKLKPGIKILDIGCGWGPLAKFASEKYKVKVLGVTISREQLKLARKRCKGLDVEIKFQDYRDIKGKFDRVVSVGMFEHVGHKNYRRFMKIVDNCLKDDGLFLLHTIGGNKTTVTTDPWLDKYIFPNGMTPSEEQIVNTKKGIFKIEDWHNLGVDYDKTLMAWHKNFNENWNKIKTHYSERFRRMWNYYLLSCAGSFRARRNQLWQIVFSKFKFRKNYRSVR